MSINDAPTGKKLPEDAYVLPSGYDYSALRSRADRGDKNTGGWCAPSACAVGICTTGDGEHDEGCPRPGWGYEPVTLYAPEIIDLPTLTVKRGGVRWWPMLPYELFTVKKIRLFTWAVIACPAADPRFPITMCEFRSRKKAMRAMMQLRKYQNALYDEIKLRVETGANW